MHSRQPFNCTVLACALSLYVLPASFSSYAQSYSNVDDNVQKYKEIASCLERTPTLQGDKCWNNNNNGNQPSNPNTSGGYSPQGCQNIAGPYVRPRDNLIIFWEQNGCDIIANTPSQGFDHSIQGRWSGSYFDYTISRRNIVDGCTTKMYGRLYQENAFRLRSEVYGTDGRCDLPPNFTENSVWDKR